MHSGLRSYLHVIVQFTCILLLIPYKYQGHVFILEIFIFFGIVLGLWSVWVMQKSVLTIMPEPAENFKLIIHGPYKVIRHPMYTALFMVLIPFVIYDFSFFRLSLMIVFTINQVVKLLYEEKLLVKKDPAYKIYMSSTWRLVPILF